MKFKFLAFTSIAGAFFHRTLHSPLLFSPIPLQFHQILQVQSSMNF